MVLKRLIVTALGALGLGALVSGPASAQEIPAPDLFDGQVACSMNVPTPPMTLVGRDAMTMMNIGITAKIATNMAIVVDADGTPDTDDDFVPSGDDADLADILYVIPAMYSNCGAGTFTADEATAHNAANMLTGDAAVEAGDAKLITGDMDMIAADVGAGYTATLALFEKAVEADDDVAAKRKVLNGYLEDDTADVEQTTLITNARKELAESQEAQGKAHAALYAATGPDRDGSIYRAGVAEWRAKGAVEKAIAAWNTAVTGYTTAESTLVDDTTSTFADYVPLGSSGTTDGQILSLIGDVTDPESTVDLANLRTYANADGSNAASQDSMTGAITNSSTGTNFDAAGNLIVPMGDTDTTADGIQLGPTTAASTYAAANTQLTSINNVVTALEKLQSENKNALLQGAIDEAVRRAKLEQAHYKAQFDKLVADNTDLEPGTDGVQSFKTRYAALTKARVTRANAGVTLETAVQARETATAAVRTAFTNPQSFYQQLVDRRQYVKDLADAEVTRLAGLTGDNAATQKETDDAAKAVTDAQKALSGAQATLESFQGLIADDSPVKDLVLETLKPDTGTDAGDDGQALVDAITGAHQDLSELETMAENAETAAEAAGNAVAALTAMDDPDTEEDETGAITKLENQISGITGEGGQVSQNTSGIEDLDGRVAENEDDIAQLNMDIYGDTSSQHSDASACAEGAAGLLNTANCADARSRHNAADIADLDGEVEALDGRVGDNEDAIMANTMEIGMDENGMSRIDHNEARSMQNATDIMTNAGDIMTNTGNIAMNAEGIMANAEGIMTNAGNIMTNSENIMTNANNIMSEGEMRMAADTMLQGMIETNASDIMMNAGNIMTNSGNISSNADAIASNMNSIGQNSAMISDNRNMIGELSDDLDVVRSGVAASMALAGMPAVNGRGIAIGVGSFDGESAFAVGFQIQGEQASFKVGVTSSGGATGASAGVGFNF